MSSNQRMQLFNMVERAYAQALIELAEAENSESSILAQVAQIDELVRKEPDIIRVLSARTLSYPQRDETCRKLFENRVSDLMFRFLRLLVSKDRFDEFPGIAAAFLFLHDERHGDIEVQAYTASGLDDASRQRIIDRVKELTNRQARLIEHVDPQLLGGLKMRVRDELVDGSLVTQLQLIKEQLADKGRPWIRDRVESLIH